MFVRPYQLSIEGYKPFIIYEWRAFCQWYAISSHSGLRFSCRRV